MLPAPPAPVAVRHPVPERGGGPAGPDPGSGPGGPPPHGGPPLAGDGPLLRSHQGQRSPRRLSNGSVGTLFFLFKCILTSFNHGREEGRWPGSKILFRYFYVNLFRYYLNNS